ncbi:M14 family zinc carboxypeptidase [Kibdelosporangium aridum]|uniref:Zinc carboxypeptidase n=1 Tax=Kibdelosporangium aridum TaxID=2030 RepID=A0A1W2BC94_KIBAR|nr:M14 family zinc carboxypeptidase [Kibdelosporangium aridum]SMC70526.1 Zinc carboxypeptidase [Kibdelosporangium aridum]
MKVRIGVVAAALAVPLVLVNTPSNAPSAAQNEVVQPDPAPYYWQVPGASERALKAAGFDVEHGDGGALQVVGDQRVADQLAGLGFRPVRHDTVYKDVLPRVADVGVQTFYGGYRTAAENAKRLTDAAAAFPALTQVYDIGDSWLKTQGRGGHDIRAVCITKKQAGDCALNPNSAKPRFAMIAQLHARELATSELAWRWIDHLTKGYGSDPEVTSIMDTTEMWVVPVANPDGVDIVASGGNSPRMQRKNANNPTGCAVPTGGVDLNRNSTFKWGGAGTSRCGETYQGTSAGSEPETRALEAWFKQLFPDQRGPGDTDVAPVTTKGVMITVHSYGNLIMPPWGWTWNANPNKAGLDALGRKMAAFNSYTVRAEGDTTGTTDDFTYGNLGIASYTFELGSSSGNCGGFFPQYSCVDSLFWPRNKGALLTAAKAAKAPYAS